MAGERRQSEFTRRKFTLPENLDSAVETLAAQHYHGNVSLYLRAAIEDHRVTLENGDGAGISMQKIITHLQSQADFLEGISARVDTLNEQVEQYQTVASPYIHTTLASDDPDQRRVFMAIHNADGGLRLADIDERMSIPMSRIHDAVLKLRDIGLIRCDSGRCYLAGQGPEGRT